MEKLMNPKTNAFSIIILALFTTLAIGKPLYVGSFNINSANTSATTIARQMSEQKEIDIWGISESCHEFPAKIKPILKQVGDYEVVNGSTGRDKNRLQIYYKQNKYRLLSHLELDNINKFNRVRAPLIAKFLDIETNKEFFFMVNHLYRNDNNARLEQAQQLNVWAKQQSLPIIAVGDYNFDLSPYNPNDRGPGFDALIKDSTFTWIMPSLLLPSQCSSYNSILDFVFISNKVVANNYSSDILYPEDGYCKNSKYSDHRPLIAMIDF